MAAGAIPPPLFFGQRPPLLKWQMGHLATAFPEFSVLRTTSGVDHAVKRPARSCDQKRTARLKDI
jgi:hypothetical protein